MRKRFLALLTGALVLVLSAGVGLSVAGTTASATDPATSGGTDNLSHPLGEKQEALRQVALQKVAKGEIPAGTKVGKVAKGQYVELKREGEDSIFTVLGEFGNQINPTYGGSAGPLHNQIPEPDRATDNTTIWASDFSQSYYNDLLFDDAPGQNSMRNFYKEQSSNRYTVNGEVTNWVTVPFNEANYGANYCGSIVCARTWLFVRDSINAWYNAQVAAGKTQAQINADLAKFDVWDRYDQDGDGNFNEPDGYIDHFQSIHAGVGEETGGGQQGTAAIWSHRWYVQLTPIGGGGPTLDDGTVVPYGGVRLGQSKYWIGDYTIEPENGGVGVFSHEFAHDLGLPDEYDTSGNTGGAENGTGFWTLMSQGSYGNNGTAAEGIGDRPFHMNAWDKLYLGWLDATVLKPGDKKTSLKLGPAEATTKQDQAVVVVLPDKPVDFNFGAAAAGSKFYYSGSADDLDTAMTRTVTLPPGTPSLTAQVRTNIETDWDYAYLTVNGTPVLTTLSTSTNPNNNNLGNGITGPRANWTPLSANLSAYAGQTVTIGFRYRTDGAQQGQPGASGVPGFQVDEIAISGQPTDGAETDAGWTFTPADGSGFHATASTVTRYFFNAYVAENRQYLGYDAGLRTGPYNFGGTIGPNWAERLPLQDGLLVWYWDESFGDNNVGDHPGGGLILPVDANPGPLHWANGSVMRPRLQSFDATFTTQATDAITVHNGGVATTIPSRPGVSTFDDSQSYWVSGDPGDAPGTTRYQSEWNSVKVPKTGTSIRVTSVTPGGFMQVQVTPPGK
jgi:immune inhibitor A